VAKVRLAFIGCGGIARSHLEAGLAGFPDVEFVGWCDQSETAAAARREQVGGQGKVYAEAGKMLVESRPDAVFIMVPPFAHGEPEAEVIKHHLPFLVEKPVVLDTAIGRRILRGVKRNDLLTSVGYMNRYRRSVQRVRELVAKQSPVIMHGGWLGGSPGSWDHWWVRKHLSGGQFLEQTTHDTDLARYLFGDVAKVYAVAVRDRQKHTPFFTIEDASMVQLTFRNGAAANLYSSVSTPVDTHGGISLTLWTDGMQAEFSGWEHAVKITLLGGEEVRIPGEDKIFAVEDRAFVDSVKAGQNRGILCTYEDGLKTAAVACAANESMETGQAVVPVI
jgi:myo-inositol 2-dehydrogenase / D-chiro-inositol 1-dehydrogenase